MRNGFRWQTWVLVALPVAGIAAGLWLRTNIRDVPAPSSMPRERAAGLFPETVRPVTSPGRVDARLDERGAPSPMACGTCHSLRAPDRLLRTSAGLTAFHQGLEFEHGGLACRACHNSGNYDTLRLSDGTAVPFAGVRRLCAQCHPGKAEAYAHGAHGGMTGYWDRTRGPRTRNDCVHCHNPHRPAWPQVRPMPFTPARGEP